MHSCEDPDRCLKLSELVSSLVTALESVKKNWKIMFPCHIRDACWTKSYFYCAVHRSVLSNLMQYIMFESVFSQNMNVCYVTILLIKERHQLSTSPQYVTMAHQTIICNIYTNIPTGSVGTWHLRKSGIILTSDSSNSYCMHFLLLRTTTRPLLVVVLVV